MRPDITPPSDADDVSTRTASGRFLESSCEQINVVLFCKGIEPIFRGAESERRERVLTAPALLFAHGYRCDGEPLAEEWALALRDFNCFPEEELSSGRRARERLLLHVFTEDGVEGLLDSMFRDAPDCSRCTGRSSPRRPDLRERGLDAPDARARSRAWIRGSESMALAHDVSSRARAVPS